jgi:enoyl-CoA hydratase/carnithine racemase
MLSNELPLLFERDARGVVTLTLNRPQSFNALSEAMLDALQSALERVAGDEAARAVVIGATGKAFCAGHDLKEMRASPSIDYYEKLFAQCGRMMMSIQRLPVPMIARVQGIATAAGCQLVAMCDLAVASRDARFAVSGINVGLFCSTPSVALSRNVPRKAAFEMLVTGDFVSAEQALAKGLVNRCDGQSVVLPPARDGNRRGLRRRRPHDGLQHDGCVRTRWRAGVHRQETLGLRERLPSAHDADHPLSRPPLSALARAHAAARCRAARDERAADGPG